MVPRIILRPAGGQEKYELQAESLTLSRSMNEPGSMEIVCLPNPVFELGGQIFVEFPGEKEVYWEIQEVERKRLANTDRVTLRCVDALAKLSERIIFGYSDTALGYKIGPTTQVIEELIREQFATPADSSRAFPSALVVRATGAFPDAPVYEGEVAWRNLLDTIKEICDYSMAAGYPIAVNGSRFFNSLFFSVVPIAPPTNTLPLRAFETMGAEYTVISSTKDRVTRVYVGGDGRDSDKLVIPVNQDALIFSNLGKQPLGFYAEKLLDLGTEDDIDALTAAGKAELAKSLPRTGITFSGTAPAEEYWNTKLFYMQSTRVTTPYGVFDVYLTSYSLSFERGGPVILEYTMKEMV